MQLQQEWEYIVKCLHMHGTTKSFLQLSFEHAATEAQYRMITTLMKMPLPAMPKRWPKTWRTKTARQQKVLTKSRLIGMPMRHDVGVARLIMCCTPPCREKRWRRRLCRCRRRLRRRLRRCRRRRRILAQVYVDISSQLDLPLFGP